jgi:hypothetical protein
VTARICAGPSVPQARQVCRSRSIPVLTLDSGPDLESTAVSTPIPSLPVSSAITLREAVEAGLLGGLTLAGARTATHRDPAFRRHVGMDGFTGLYEPAALAEWARGRG